MLRVSSARLEHRTPNTSGTLIFILILFFGLRTSAVDQTFDRFSMTGPVAQFLAKTCEVLYMSCIVNVHSGGPV